jgi:hypothetical protein
MILTLTVRDDNGEALGVIVAAPKTFATGSEGYHGQAKITIDGRRFQCQAQLVQIREKSEEAKQ